MSQSFTVSFSYNQIVIYDSSVSQPGCLWTEAHFAQGFVRREGVVCFGTLLQSGKAQVEVIHGDYVPGAFERVIRCPISVPSGSLWVVGPDEWPEPGDHRVEIVPGLQSVTCGQLISSPGGIRVVLWLSKAAVSHSQILVADSQIEPSARLIEVGEVA